jgi:hypothetical protein
MYPRSVLRPLHDYKSLAQRSPNVGSRGQPARSQRGFETRWYSY